MRDPYAVLGVAKTASATDVKSAFRKLAKKYHPDQNAEDPKAKERFAEINQAYEILGDVKKRAEFDAGVIDAAGKPRFSGGPGGQHPFGGEGNPFSGGGSPFSGAANPFEGFGPFAGASDRRKASQADDILSEIFGTAFGPSVERRKSNRSFKPDAGRDIQITRDVTLDDLAAGTVEVELPTGSRLNVKLPKGIEDGQTIRLKGQGYPSSMGGTPGDAQITVRIRQEGRRRVDGLNVHVDAAVPLDVAILGGKVPVDTVDGRIALTIPPMTDGDKVMRLRGRGLEGKDGERGDLLVAIRLMLPKDDADDLKIFAERLRASS